MRTMIHRHLHGHGHGHSHLRVRESVPRSDKGVQVEELGLNTHDVLPSGDDLVQIASRANNLDEKPSTDNSATTIAVSVVIPLVVAIAVIAYFARKGILRRRQEEAASKFKSMDFGLQETGLPKAGKRKSAFFGKEKDGGHKTQLSMDMNLSSPYLLPPNLHNSRESFNSLAKTLHASDDPYRPVTDYTGSDVGSLRSFARGPATRTSSIYTSKTRPSGDMPRQQREAPTSPLQSPLPVAQSLSHSPVQQEEIPSIPAKNEFRFVDDGPGITQVPAIQEPAAVAISATRKAVAPNSPVSPEIKQSPVPMVAEIVNERDSLPRVESNGQMHPTGLGIIDRHMSQASATSQGSDVKGAPTAIRPPRKESMPVINAPRLNEEYQGYADELHFDDNQFGSHRDEDELHMSINHEQVHPHSAGLGVPEQDNRRLSVGLRPLPPDDFLESEDPEFRANRIRSFYKELHGR
ncbi:hypothetical protein NPX13_g6594 [Xylaria arbuscula]|uniref:Uncharacterized protein n=1 Tax=Xylaria arbuscula TaxID=114810 RepID=A0A9W8NBX5_9PEZI|nr:hypothetical protein NPX13_g6594 [Xylaria arbuscula]